MIISTKRYSIFLASCLFLIGFNRYICPMESSSRSFTCYGVGSHPSPTALSATVLLPLLGTRTVLNGIIENTYPDKGGNIQFRTLTGTNAMVPENAIVSLESEEELSNKLLMALSEKNPAIIFLSPRLDTWINTHCLPGHEKSRDLLPAITIYCRYTIERSIISQKADEMRSNGEAEHNSPLFISSLALTNLSDKLTITELAEARTNFSKVVRSNTPAHKLIDKLLALKGYNEQV
jgi:hypothetical protein